MRNYSNFVMPSAETVNYGLESLSYIGSKDTFIPFSRGVSKVGVVVFTWLQDLVVYL